MNTSFENPCPGQANGLPAYYFMQTVQMLIATHCTIGNPEDYPKDYKSAIKEDSFDFIIVGGGSSGAVIANRLSEIKNWKVLLIESGLDPTFESDIPGFGLSLPGRDLDWKFSTNRTENSCLGMEDETCSIFQGKVLGGTSTINRMHYLRGRPEDYNEWGEPDWGYENLLKYFKKSEKVDEDFVIMNEADYETYFEELKYSAGANDFKLYQLSRVLTGKHHSKAGLLSVNHFAYDFTAQKVKRAVFSGADEVGVGHVGDLNGKISTGYTRALGCIDEGNRGNTAKAFLTPVKDRKNLFVLKNTTVTKLLFDGDAVTGVSYVKDGIIQTVKASKEVILSAGAINTPRLLLLSGVGPETHLKNLGIKVVKDLPGVGQNLQAHLTFFGLPVALLGLSKTITHLQKIDAMYQYISRGMGFYGSIGMADVVGFVSTKNDSLPDVEILHYLNHLRDYYTFNELLISLKIKNEIRDQFSKAYAKSNVLLICPTLLKPKSRGSVELSDSDFRNPPKIQGNFLKDFEDVETLLRGIKFVLKLIQTKAFEELEPEVVKLEINNCRGLGFNTDGYWKCLLRHLTTSMFDVAGTCKMGPREDSSAVVDGSLKVHGVKGLRVADSSIMPTIIRGSVSVGSVMIAEKVSDLIKKEWKKVKHEEL